MDQKLLLDIRKKNKDGKGKDEKEKNVPELKGETRPVFLLEFFSKLLLTEKFSDVKFVVGEGDEKKTFPAHRVVLAASSPLFEAMLYPPSFVENAPEIKLPLTITITDPNITPSSFESLLRVIYTDETKVNASNISELIACAKKYQIEKLQILCAEFMEADIQSDNVLSLYEIAPDLLGDNEFGLSFIRANAEEVFSSEGFVNLKRERLIPLLKDDDLSIEEQSVFKAVQRWGRRQLENDGIDSKDGSALKKVLSDILPLVRFPVMDVADIATSVAPSGLLDNAQLLELFRYASISDVKARKLVEMSFPSVPRQSGFSITGDTKLLDAKYKKDIIKMFDAGSKTLKFTLIYSGSRDGFNAKKFHDKCDGKGPTFTMVRAKETGNIFGGYFEGSWAGSQYKTEKSWLYSLKNSTGKVLKYNPQNTTNNAYAQKSMGPTWGGGHDLHINNEMTANKNTCNPNVYKNADSKFHNTTILNTTLAGAASFAVDEIEVFNAVLKA